MRGLASGGGVGGHGGGGGGGGGFEFLGLPFRGGGGGGGGDADDCGETNGSGSTWMFFSGRGAGRRLKAVRQREYMMSKPTYAHKISESSHRRQRIALQCRLGRRQHRKPLFLL